MNVKEKTVLIVVCILFAVVVAAVVALSILFYRTNNELEKGKDTLKNQETVLSEKESEIVSLNKKINDGNNRIKELKKTSASKAGKIKSNKKKISASNFLNMTSKEVESVTKVKDAYEVLGWFKGLGSPDMNGNGKITDSRCNTMGKMKLFLGGYFSPGFVRELINSGCYTSKNGGLYYTSGERGGRIDYLYCRYRFKDVSKNKRTIDTTVCTWKNFEEYPKEIAEEHLTFEQVKINGKWVFSKIELPY